MTILEKRLGELRPTQLIHSFGIGSIIDLPHFSVMLLGLDDWPEGYCGSIAEDRLLRAVQARLGPQVQKLASPPFEPDNDGVFAPNGLRIGIPVATFPRVLRCPFCSLLAPLDRFRLKTVPGRPDLAKYIHANCNKAREPTVLPARFLVACTRGHVDDFPWHEFVHDGPSACPSDLHLDERGGTEASDVLVRCRTCGKGPRPMSDAFGAGAKLPACRGRRPHLRDFEGCTDLPKAILLGASNGWFAISLSALAIPQSGHDELAQLIEAYWELLQRAKSRDVVEFLQSEGKLPRLSAYGPDPIFAAVEARRAGAMREEPEDLKVPEWKAFTAMDPSQRTTDFELEEVAVRVDFSPFLARVVLVRRIR